MTLINFKTLFCVKKNTNNFLKTNPVFLDPLANVVIPKQQLANEMTTDFVIRRLDNEYIVVEIEKTT